MKIVIAVHHFPPHYTGGAEWRAHRTAKWLQSQGHTVQVICVESVSDTSTADLRWIDEEFDSLRVRRLFLNLPNAPDSVKWEYDNPWIEAHLSQYLAEVKPDILHLISGYLMTAAAIKAARSQPIPIVATLTDFWFLCQRHTLYRTSGKVCTENSPLDCLRCTLEEQRRFRFPAQKVPLLADVVWGWAQSHPAVAERVTKVEERVATLRAALNEVNVAICPSNFLKQTYESKGFGAKSMRFIRQGLAHVPQYPLKKSPSTQLRIGYIGQIASHKGVHVLIEAFLQLHSMSKVAPLLKLYGDVSQFPDFYRNLQKKVGLDKQIQFMGTFSNHQISQIYEEIDVLVVPSIWYENSPNVILEAFAHQTPVVTSDLGGMAELVIDQKTGLLFIPNNADNLAQKLRMILDDPQLLSQWQKNMAPPLTLEAEMAELVAIYQSVLDEKDNSGVCLDLQTSKADNSGSMVESASAP